MSNTTKAPLIDVLLAEDEEHIAKLVSFKLGREGFQVTVARNGQEAIELLKTRTWPLVILDVMMPICDGWEVLKVLRTTPLNLATPVLMLTAKGYQKDMVNAVELGVQQYLKKPFDPKELADVAKKMVQK